MSGARVVTQRLVPAGTRSSQKGAHAGSHDESWRRLHPRGVGELLDQCFSVYVTHFGVLVGFAVLCYLPLHLLFDAVVRPILVQEGWQVAMGALRDTLPMLLSTGFVTLFLGARMLKQESALGATLLGTLSSVPGLFVLNLLRWLITALLCCFLVLPGVLAVWLLSAVLAVFLLEGRTLALARRPGHKGWLLFPGLFLSIGRSWRLLWSFESLGRFAGAGVGIWAVVYFPLIGLSVLQEDPSLRADLMSMEFFDSSMARLLMVLLGAVGMAAGAVFIDIFLTLFYFDMRVRREALDLDLELSALRERRGPA